MKSNTSQLVKYHLLKMRMKAPKYQVSGVLEELWQFTAKNAPLGDIGKFKNIHIAAMLEWDGDPDELVAMLVEAEWLDESEEFRLIVHDWHDHAPNYIKGNVQRHNLVWASKSASLPGEIKIPTPDLPREPPRDPPKENFEPPYEPPKEGPSLTQTPPQGGPSLARKPPTKPSQVKPSQVKPIQDGLFSEKPTDQKPPLPEVEDEKPPDDPGEIPTTVAVVAPPVKSRYTESFLEFWQAYPSGRRKTKKADAAKAWAAEVERPKLDTDAVAEIIEAVREYAESPEGAGDYCPGPGPWIRSRRWEDDRTSWQSRQTKETLGDRNQAALEKSLEIGDDYISVFDQMRAMAAANRADSENTVDAQVDDRIGGDQ